MAGHPAEHDQPPTGHDQEATTAIRDLLSGLRLQGAIFLRGEYTERWAYQSMPSADAAALLAPGAPQVLLFHVIASGRCWVQVEGGEKHWAGAGDVIVLPYNDDHQMGGTDDAVAVSVTSLIDPPPWERVPMIQYGEGGALTSVFCGYLISDDDLFDRRLRVFPPVLVVTPPPGPAREWVRASIEYAVQQTSRVDIDRLQAPTPVPQLLLVEILSLHLASAPSADRGWARAIRDPVLKPALAAIHGSPATKWTVARLAREVHVSSSLLDERFREVLGLAPIRYLTGWRMHVAEDLLQTSDLSVVAVARQVGYDSEEAFSRAFKRMHGKAPSVWRVERP